MVDYETLYGTSTFYFGETSIFGKLASAKFLPATETLREGYIPSFPSDPASLRHSLIVRLLEELPRDSVSALVQLYCQKVETYYSILGTTVPFDMIRSVYEDRPLDAMSREQCRAFLNLMIAVALIAPFEGRSASFASAVVYFERALSLASTTDGLLLTSTITSLRFTLLVCFYVWLHPSSGNLFRLVNAACRICLDLLESKDLQLEETALLRTLFQTTYVMDT